MFLFQSDLWQYSERHMLVKNMILDFFRGEEVDTINLTGLSYVIAVTAIGDESDEKPKIFFRVYCVSFRVPLTCSDGAEEGGGRVPPCGAGADGSLTGPGDSPRA